jgi:rhamnogalacturonyl hydrolase YesR
LQEEIQDARDTLMSSTTEALEMVRTTYENTINKIGKDFEEFMVGAGDSIAHLQEQYGYFQEEQERYVSTAKELYEVSKLNRDIEGTLATTTSSAAKEALKALQEKINKQSELNQLTEYDIEMNQLQYQLLLARIKLEES